ncbi:MAG: PKD domain-containing protein, partial [Candidatus Thermoplasmatota archaeon]|nr:PKD domain-containing protein [Candidatus Thermoplasmatota archaeon]
TDVAENWFTDTMNVTVLDITSPVADAGPDQMIDEGNNVVFDGSGSTDNVGIANWTWTFNDGIENNNIFGQTPTYIFTVPGIYNVRLNVSDAAGNWATDTMTVTVKDITRPIAYAGSDQIVDEGSTVIFDGIGSYDNVGIVNFTWTFIDGKSITLYGPTPEYIFNNPGLFIVALTVVDVAGNWATATVEV